MPFLSIFRRRNENGDDQQSQSTNRRNGRGRFSLWPTRRRPINDTYFFGLCDFRISSIFLNILNFAFTLLLWGLGFVNVRNDGTHLFASIFFSLIGILGALYVNVTLTAISTIGFLVLLVFYFVVLYLPGFITLGLIVLSQTIFLYEIRQGYFLKESNSMDNDLLSKESSEIVENAKNVANDIVDFVTP
jgi:hypothetical protein